MNLFILIANVVTLAVIVINFRIQLKVNDEQNKANKAYNEALFVLHTRLANLERHLPDADTLQGETHVH